MIHSVIIPVYAPIIISYTIHIALIPASPILIHFGFSCQETIVHITTATIGIKLTQFSYVKIPAITRRVIKINNTITFGLNFFLSNT